MVEFRARDYILNGKQIIEQKPDFSKTATAVSTGKLYKDADNDGDTYYYRGSVEDNYFKFADKFWRIIRINGNGSLKIIYDGDKAYPNNDNNNGENRQISKMAFNKSYSNNAHVGFRFKTGELRGLENPSTVLGEDIDSTDGTLNKWYEDNIKNKQLDKYIDIEEGFWGDRSNSTTKTTKYGEQTDDGGTGAKTTYYGGYLRTNKDGVWGYVTQYPTFKYNNKEDLYTSKNSTKGNKSLVYPIGLITADEAIFSGMLAGVQESKSSYLYTGTSYWTMTPYRFDSVKRAYIMYIGGFVSLNGDFTGGIWATYSSTLGVRPVLNILGSVNLKGDGTMENPYEIVEYHHKLIKNGKIVQDIYKNGKKLLGIAHNGELIWKYEENIPTIKTFAEASDEEIAKYLDLHYAGKINIADYWHVGDTRLIHLNATNQLKQTYRTIHNHVDQDITIVIIDFNHDNLVNPIGVRDKAAITVQTRESLGNDPNAELQQYEDSISYYDNDNVVWSSQESLRNYCNDILYNAFDIKELIKTVHKKSLKYHSKTNESPILTEDKVFLLSYSEVFGDKTTFKNEFFQYYLGSQALEGEQYPYYLDQKKCMKYRNKQGIAGTNSNSWWLRSPSSEKPSSKDPYYNCIVAFYSSYDGGRPGSLVGLDYGISSTAAVAPAFCL